MSCYGGQSSAAQGLVEPPSFQGLVRGCWATIKALVTGASLTPFGG